MRVRQGGGWGRNGYHVTKGLAELIVFFLPNYGEGVGPIIRSLSIRTLCFASEGGPPSLQ